MQNRNRLEDDLQMQLAKFESCLCRMRIAVKEADDEARPELSQKLQDLEKLKEKAEEKLIQLKSASESNWHSAEAKARSVWDSMGRELQAYNPDNRNW